MNNADLPPGQYGSMNLLPTADHVNPTDEELMWPIVKSVQRGQSTVFLGPNDSVTTGEISLVEQPLALTAEKSIGCEIPPLHQIVRKTG